MGTITKALELLDLFSPARPQIGLGDFVRLTGRDKATLHRHLAELEQNGFVDRNPESRAYRLGPAILRLSAVREATNPFRSVLRPIVTALAEQVGELAHASLLQGLQLSPAFHHEPAHHGTQVYFDPAEMLPMHATSSGLALLAFAPRAMVEKVLAGPLDQSASHTVTDRHRLREMLGEVRAHGYCRLFRGFDDEVASQGAPLFGPAGEVIGAISVAVPTSRADPERLDAILPPLLAAAKAATEALGGSQPQSASANNGEAPSPRSLTG